MANLNVLEPLHKQKSWRKCTDFDVFMAWSLSSMFLLILVNDHLTIKTTLMEGLFEEFHSIRGGMVVPKVKGRSNFEIPKDTPYLALTGKLWGIFGVYFIEKCPWNFPRSMCYLWRCRLWANRHELQQSVEYGTARATDGSRQHQVSIILSIVFTSSII